jgi:DNA/RNA-binding domain of Phe-tRNA-synthetase-like protein
MLLDVYPNLLELGLACCALIVRNADNTRTRPELIAYRRQVGQKLAGFWKNRSISTHPAIREYHRVHEQFGVIGQAPAPEKLITYVRRQRDLTATSALVDCYNLVSVRTLLSIGAHDLKKLVTPITLRPCTPADTYTPLGGGEELPLAGEYAYIDPQNRVICRLETLQGDYSKVTPESRDVVFFLQGNRCLPAASLLKGAWLLAELLEKFCGGKAELESFHDASANPGSSLNKPTSTVEVFKQMNARVGTVVAVDPLATLPALSKIRVRLDSEVEALALTSTIPEGATGRRVLVITDLHPLAIAGDSYGAYVPAVCSESGGEIPEIVSAIPDGKRLY